MRNAIVLPGVTAVSYTHLHRVIRRDATFLVANGLRDGVIGRPAFRSLEILGAALQADGGTRSRICGLKHQKETVSYTHLDVYKRQAWYTT